MPKRSNLIPGGTSTLLMFNYETKERGMVSYIVDPLFPKAFY